MKVYSDGKNYPGKKKKKGHVKSFFISFFATVFVMFLIGVFLMYGPISYFRDLWVTTAMSTLNHQWLATMFFSNDDINAILAKNRTDDTKDETDSNKVTVIDKTPKDNATTLPTSPNDGERIINGIGFIRLHTATYEGWVIKVYDPSRIHMELSQGYGNSGERVTRMVQRTDSFIGINAGGFVDVNGHGNGGVSDRVLISNKKLITIGNYKDTHYITGFDYLGKLLLTRCEHSEVKSLTNTYRDAVEFKPFLIINGKPTEMYGNGGYGIQPRTAIGQTKDGVVIFIQIDGRRPPVIGASVKELQRLFVQYNAYNAANLDGGSSSVFAYKGELKNKPSSSGGERFVPDAFLISYKK